MPARLASVAIANFVGRAAEREQLAAAWKAIVAEVSGGWCCVSGEPGIGKTTLAAWFAADVSETGAPVVYGRCDEDLGIPYQPWIEALTQLVAQRRSRSSRARGGSGRTSLASCRSWRRVSLEVPRPGR